MRATIRILLALSLLGTFLSCRRSGNEVVRVLTSTEVAGTGMPQLLLARFTAESGIRTELQIVEASALRTHDYGDRAAVVITNDPRAVRQLAGRTRLRSIFARGDFMIVGPKNDPAGVRSAADATDAFHRIIDAKSPFCSALSVPRFRAKESEIWASAGIDPRNQRRYLMCRGDGKPFFRELKRRRAYALIDRGSFASVPGSERPVVLLEGTPQLQNDYLVLLVARKRARNAEWLVQWVMSYRGRETVEAHRFGGQRRLFAP